MSISFDALDLLDKLIRKPKFDSYYDDDKINADHAANLETPKDKRAWDIQGDGDTGVCEVTIYDKQGRPLKKVTLNNLERAKSYLRTYELKRTAAAMFDIDYLEQLAKLAKAVKI